MSGEIFISYRRDDSAGTAGRLYDRLIRTFPPEKVFMDVDASMHGLDFVRVLNDHIAACDAVAVVIGPDWVSAVTAAGKRRIEDPLDFVRMEVAAALNRDIAVVPVLVDGAQMPSESELPDDLRALPRRHAVEIRNTRFRDDADLLVAALAQRVGLKSTRARRWPRYAAVIGGAAAAAAAAIFFWNPLGIDHLIKRDVAGADALLATSQAQDAQRAAELQRKADEVRERLAKLEDADRLRKELEAAERRRQEEAAEQLSRQKAAEAAQREAAAARAASQAQEAQRSAESQRKADEVKDRLAKLEEADRLRKESEAAERRRQDEAAEQLSRQKAAEAAQREAVAAAQRLEEEKVLQQRAESMRAEVAKLEEERRKALENSQSESRPSVAPQAAQQVAYFSISSQVSQGIHNMRSGPGTGHGLVVSIPARSSGVAVNLSSCRPADDGKSRHNWCRASWNNKSGWLSMGGLVR